MSFTNSTPNLHLPQWIGGDKPQFATDMNNAFSTIDSAVTNIKNQQDTTDEQFKQIKTNFEQIETDFAELQQGVQNANNTANSAKAIANNALELTSDIAEWYETTLDIKDVPIIDVQSNHFLHMHYNPKLKLLIFELSISKGEGNNWVPLSNYKQFAIPEIEYTYYAFPFLKLPIKATNVKTAFFDNIYSERRSLTISGTKFSVRLGYNGGLMVNDDGFLYLFFSSSSSSPYTISREIDVIDVSNFTVNLNGHFENIQLTDWTKVS